MLSSEDHRSDSDLFQGPLATFLTKKFQELNKAVTAEHDRLISKREQQYVAEVAQLRSELAAVRQQGGNQDSVMTKHDNDADGRIAGFEHEFGANLDHQPRFDVTGVTEQDVDAEKDCEGDHLRSLSKGSNVANLEAMKDIDDIVRAVRNLDGKLSRRTHHKLELERKSKRRQVKRVWVAEQLINPIVCVIILVNAITIGVSIDVEPDWVGWVVIDALFVTVYVVEMLCKWCIVGIRAFFCGQHGAWNWFDFFIVVISMGDVIMTIAWQGEETLTSSSYVIMRLFRLNRFGRIVRLFEFDVFRELLTMLHGLLSGLRTLCWAFVLLFLPVYALGLALTSMLGTQEDIDPLVASAVGSVPNSMFLVFRCTIGDCSLPNGTPVITTLTSNYGWFYGAVYVVATMLVTFGIFNLIMATFVDNALTAAKQNERDRLKNRLKDTDRQVTLTSRLIYKMWENARPKDSKLAFSYSTAGQCSISKEVFEKTLEDFEAQQLLADLDVAEEDWLGLFDVLDADDGGTLHLFEIIRGVLKLRGEPRRSDVVQVVLMVRSVQDSIKQLLKQHPELQRPPVLDDVASV
mmetsp:Transcript_23472/g.45623  ORF Transcript_23472/g.45623 Transcript_23472/m.45623 type:complete len:576 (-) Transcript_23472:53-1780(-)